MLRNFLDQLLPLRAAFRHFRSQGSVHVRHVAQYAVNNLVEAERLVGKLEKKGVPVERSFVFRYEREDGEAREITLNATSEESGRELADRRLGEQYGEAYAHKRGDFGRFEFHDDGTPVMVRRPDLDQEHYRFVAARRQ